MTQLSQANLSAAFPPRRLSHHVKVDSHRWSLQTSGSSLVDKKSDDRVSATIDVNRQHQVQLDDWPRSHCTVDNFSVVSSSENHIDKGCKDEPFSTARSSRGTVQQGTFQPNKDSNREGASSSRPLVQHDYRDHAFQPYAFPSTHFSGSNEISQSAVKALWSSPDKSCTAHVLSPSEQSKSPRSVVVKSIQNAELPYAAHDQRRLSASLSGAQLSGEQLLGQRHHCFTSPLALSGDETTGPFPQKLHYLLKSTSEDKHLRLIISWQPHGRSFIVRMPDKLVAILARYFRHCKLASFQRQLNLYGFKRITQGPDRGAYYHEFFLRGRPSLCRYITRIGIKGIKVKPLPNPSMEPNFYAMNPCFEDDNLNADSSASNQGMVWEPSYPPHSPLRLLSLKEVGVESDSGSKKFEGSDVASFSEFHSPARRTRHRSLHDQLRVSLNYSGVQPTSFPGDQTMSPHQSEIEGKDCISLSNESERTSQVAQMLVPFTASESMSWQNTEPIPVEGVTPSRFETKCLLSDNMRNSNVGDLTVGSNSKALGGDEKFKGHFWGSKHDDSYHHQTALSSLCLATSLHSHTAMSVSSVMMMKMFKGGYGQEKTLADDHRAAACWDESATTSPYSAAEEEEDDPLCDRDIESVDPRMLRAMEARIRPCYYC